MPEVMEPAPPWAPALPAGAHQRRPFVDPNVLLYLIAADAAKAEQAEQVLAGGIVISVQVLNEFANVARRKHSPGWDGPQQALDSIGHLCEVGV